MKASESERTSQRDVLYRKTGGREKGGGRLLDTSHNFDYPPHVCRETLPTDFCLPAVRLPRALAATPRLLNEREALLGRAGKQLRKKGRKTEKKKKEIKESSTEMLTWCLSRCQPSHTSRFLPGRLAEKSRQSKTQKIGGFSQTLQLQGVSVLVYRVHFYSRIPGSMFCGKSVWKTLFC